MELTEAKRTEEDIMKEKLTEKDRAVIKYFLLNGNKLSYQKQISEGAGVSEKHLGGHSDKNDNPEKKEGRLSKLVRAGFLDKKIGKYPNGITNFFSLKEDRTPFAELADEFLKDRDIAIFMLSQYTQRMISNEYMDGYKGLNLEEEEIAETFFGGDCVESFFEEGMKLSPTFLQYSIHERLPEVEVGANILHSALEGCPDGSPTIRIYLNGGPKKYDITLQIVDSAELLYVSLLIDAKKYPELRSKIIEFFKGPAFGPQYFNLPFPDLYRI